MFRIRDVRDLTEIVVPLFDKYPLHSKKAREYPIWKKLLLLRYKEMIGRSPHNTPYSQEYCTEFDSAIMQLRAIRKYREHEGVEAPAGNRGSRLDRDEQMLLAGMHTRERRRTHQMDRGLLHLNLERAKRRQRMQQFLV